jgi:5'(3')-deoxyribonucleotidase
MAEKVCFLDLDGVVADFVAGAVLRHNMGINKNQCRWEFDIAHCNKTGMSRSDFWDAFDYDFWRSLPKTAEAYQLVFDLTHIFGIKNICILTSPPRTKGSVDGKLEWITEHFPQFKRQFLVGPAKYFLAHPNAILVDDHDENERLFNQYGGKCILVPRPWNRRRDEVMDEEGTFNVNTIFSEVWDAAKK